MSLFDRPPLPQQRRAAAPPTPPAVGNVGAAAGTSTAAGVAPFGAGASTGSSTVAAVGAALFSGVGSAIGVGSAAATAPATNIFPLTISSDGRFLKKNDGSPFLICAQTTWSLAVNIPTADITTFLDAIVAQGFNAVMMNVVEHHYTVVKPPKERGGILPFSKRLDGATYTGTPNGTTGTNGTQGQFSADNYSSVATQSPDWTFITNSYWVILEQILDACLARNVLVFPWVAYLGFHANDEGWLAEMVANDAVTGAGGFTGFSFANASKSKLWNYGAWLADRWKAYPNIIWTMGGDYGSNSQTLNTAQKAAVNNVMDGLKSVASQQSLLFTAHWDRPCISSDTALTAGTFDLNLAYADEAPAELCRRGYAANAGPTFLGEYNYEDGSFGGTAPWRKYLYWGFLGGIAGGFFGNEQLWRFDDGTPGTDYTTLLNTQATLDASRQFAFWKARPWQRLKPDGLGGIGTLITAGGGTASPQSTSYVAAAATSAGDLLLAYVPPAHSGSVTVDMTKMSATAAARWFDPSNATFTSIGAINNSGTHAFTTPGTNSAGDADFLLVLETSAGSSAGVGAAAGVGSSLAAGAGAASGSSTAAGVSQAIASSVGSSTGSSSAAAVSAVILSGAGSSTGTGAAASVGAALAAGVGAFSGVGAAAAVGAALGIAVGGSAGSSTVSGVGAALRAGAGAAAGLSTVFGIAPGGGIGIGASAGVATALGVGAALTAGVGGAAGTATAQGVGASIAGTGAGAASGTSSVLGVGHAIAAGTGSSSGGSAMAGVVTSGDPISLVEDAIYAWVVTGSGLAPGQVIWAQPGGAAGPSPSGTYISMRLINVDSVSDDWRIARRLTNGTIENHVRGTRHPTLELTCFAGESYGSRRAEMILARVTAAVILPSVATKLRKGDVGVGEFGIVRVIPGSRSGMYDPMAIVLVPLHIKIDIFEIGLEFRTVEVTTPGPITQVVTKP